MPACSRWIFCRFVQKCRMTERVLMLILTGLHEERFKTGPHSARNMSLDLTLEDSTDMLSGGKFKLRLWGFGKPYTTLEEEVWTSIISLNCCRSAASSTFPPSCILSILQWSCNGCYLLNKSNSKAFLEETCH